MKIQSDLTLLEDSLRTSSKRIITTGPWAQCKGFKEVKNGLTQDINPSGSNLNPKETKWHLHWNLRQVSKLLSNLVSVKILKSFLKRFEFEETDKLSGKPFGKDLKTGKNLEHQPDLNSQKKELTMSYALLMMDSKLDIVLQVLQSKDKICKRS